MTSHLPLPGALLDLALRADPAGPLLTYYDLDTGERTELSATTLGNWVAKTANLLVDGLDVGEGDVVGVVVPPHWQSAAVLLAAWAVGASVSERPDDCDVLFCPESRLAELSDLPAREIVASSLDPMGRPLGLHPPHVLDFTVEVRSYGDVFSSAGPISPDALALHAGGLRLTHASLGSAAATLADRLKIGPNERVLVGADAVADGGPVPWLLTPLAVHARVILVRGGDSGPEPEPHDRLSRIADTEGATASLGLALPGIRPLGGPEI